MHAARNGYGEGSIGAGGPRPLIGITATPVQTSDGADQIRLRRTYVRAVETAGGLPVLVPPLADRAALGALLERLDGLLLPGGGDVDPAMYGEVVDGSEPPNPALDELELTAAKWAIDRNLPTLGICRGQQLINVALGGSLIQHLDGHRQDGARDRTHHALRVAPGSKLADVLGSGELQVNSLHHQAVRALGEGLVAVAWGPDGTIEGIERPDRSWVLAVQFHPEELVGKHVASERLFAAFVSACRPRAASYALRR